MTRYPVILNGDHAEFEREHANTRPEDRPDWPLPSFDANDWATAFMRHAEPLSADKVDRHDTMRAWFANALMRGFDENGSRVGSELRASFFGRLYLRSVRWSNTVDDWKRKWRSKSRPSTVHSTSSV